jgi:maltodextrin utilization protein YvdJ
MIIAIIIIIIIMIIVIIIMMMIMIIILILIVQLLTLFLLSITAPLSTKSCATSKEPLSAALCSGVDPPYERHA